MARGVIIGGTKIGALVVGGVETEDWTVMFSNLWRTNPTFHKMGDWPHGDPRWEVDATACGLAMWDPDRKRDLGISMPTVHARMFGKPCLRCWPELREEAREMAEAQAAWERGE